MCSAHKATVEKMNNVQHLTGVPLETDQLLRVVDAFLFCLLVMNHHDLKTAFYCVGSVGAKHHG